MLFTEFLLIVLVYMGAVMIGDIIVSLIDTAQWERAAQILGE